MNCRTKSCCCCISIRNGTYLIGVLHAVYFVMFLLEPNFIGASLNFFCMSTFIAMVFKDTAFTRSIFFTAFATYVVLIAVLNLYFTFFRFEEDETRFTNKVTDECTRFEVVNHGFENSQFQDLDDCVK